MSKNLVWIGLSAIGTAIITMGGTHIYKNHFYHKDGFNGKGYDREGYDREGFDKDGYDRQGFDRNGFNCDGFNCDGFNADGVDRYGFNHDGFDKEGFDKLGYNHEGYNRKGFNRNGYDRLGRDKDGYYKNGFNDEGLDRGGRNASFYQDKTKEIEKRLDKAHIQMKSNEYEYAAHEIRIGLEIGIMCVLLHCMGDSFEGNNLDKQITMCKDRNLLPRELIEDIYQAKKHCNPLQHYSNVEKDYGQMHFSYKILSELKYRVESYT